LRGNSLPFPLDIAANRWPLILERRLAGERGVNRGAQILAGDGDAIAGAAGVELAAIDEPEIAVEEKEIRGAGGVVGARHGLRLVMEIRKVEAKCRGLLREWPRHCC